MTLVRRAEGTQKKGRSPTVNSSSGSLRVANRRGGGRMRRMEDGWVRWASGSEYLSPLDCGLACTYRNFMHRPQTSAQPPSPQTPPCPSCSAAAAPCPWPKWAHLSSDPWSASQLLRLHFFAVPLWTLRLSRQKLIGCLQMCHDASTVGWSQSSFCQN